MSEDDFIDHVAAQLAALPGVEAVSLGGSRAQDTHRPDSDWDLAIYYRGEFDPQALRDVGWPGEVSQIGGWGGGIFNGGAPYGRLTQCTGLLAQAATQSAHAILAARGEWVTNEKTLLTRAGLREIDKIIAQAQQDPDSLRATVERSHTLCSAAAGKASATARPSRPNLPYSTDTVTAPQPATRSSYWLTMTRNISRTSTPTSLPD